MTFGEIKKEIQFLLGFENDIAFANYSKEAMTRHANRALDELSALIYKADGKWQFDDINHPDLPISVTDIVLGQSQYTLDVKHLTVDRLEITDAGGHHHVLIPIDELDIKISLDEYAETTGTPIYYDKQGESLILYPKPDFSANNGLKIYYTRPPFYFTEDTDTLVPGFASIFHEYIPIWVAYHYASGSKELTQIAVNMAGRLQEIKENIIKHYRGRSGRERLTVGVPNSL